MKTTPTFRIEQRTTEATQVTLGEPVTVALAPPEVRGWGPYQFPLLVRLPDGRIQLSYHVEADSTTAYGLPPACAVSPDDGLTWELQPRDTSGKGSTGSWYAPCLLPNGDRLFPVTLRPRPVAEIKLPAKPFAEYINYHMNCKVYRLEDLPPECADGYVFRRQVAGSGELREERAHVRLPGEVRVVDMPEGLMWFPWLSTQFLVAPDGSLLAASYCLRRIADGRFQEKCPVVILRSTDNGRSFDFWGEILYQPDPAADPKAADRFGFSEHWMNFMPDGAALCLLRTDDGHGQGPLYQSRSTDNGRTWSKPVVFDDLGVWPQMLTLKNGVTLAAYGRPGLYVRASVDPSGREWSKRVVMVPPGKYMGDTCSYTSFLPLSDDTALIAYSDFNVAGPDGTPRKAIRVRRVKTVSDPFLGEFAHAQEPMVWPADRALPRMVISDQTTEPLLKAEKPWEDFCVNHLRVLHIGTTWHMWYNSYDHNYKNDGDSFLCYATSEDGVHWTRPSLGLFNYGGSTNNNILAAGIGAPGVFLDLSAPPEERFKIVCIRFKDGRWQSHGGISPDGLRWKLTGLIQADNADTDNVCFRDGDIYRFYLRMWSGGVFLGKRQVGYTESRTFGNFPPPRVVLEADKDDPSDMDFYTSAATKLMPGLYVMFPGAFHRKSQNVIPHAALSRDGVSFQRTGRTPILDLGKGFDSRCIYVAPNGIPGGKPGQYWFYYLGCPVGHDANWPDKVHFANGIGRFKLTIEPPAGDNPKSGSATGRKSGDGEPEKGIH